MREFVQVDHQCCQGRFAQWKYHPGENSKLLTAVNPRSLTQIVNAIFMVYLATMMVPWHAVMIPQFMINKRLGFYNR